MEHATPQCDNSTPTGRGVLVYSVAIAKRAHWRCDALIYRRPHVPKVSGSNPRAPLAFEHVIITTSLTTGGGPVSCVQLPEGEVQVAYPLVLWSLVSGHAKVAAADHDCRVHAGAPCEHVC